MNRPDAQAGADAISQPLPRDWKPKLAAIDIDGTLVDHEGRLPQTNIDAVHRVIAAGVPVVLATGRGWHSTRPIFEALELPPGPAVCANGAAQVKFPPFEVLSVVRFDPEQVIRRVHELAPQAILAVEDVGTGYRTTREFPPGELVGEVSIESIDDLCSREVTRLVIRDPNSSVEEFDELARALGMHGVGYFIGWSAWIDIAPAGVSKASGLADVCRHLGVDQADVLAIGNGRNDIEMFEWAGRGVAMGDSASQVKAAADYVTAPFDQFGLAQELDLWF